MNRSNHPPFFDLASLPEDERIEIIGNQVMGGELTVGIYVDDEPGKADRYIEKIQARFPGIEVIGRGAGMVKGTILIRLRKRRVVEEAHA